MIENLSQYKEYIPLIVALICVLLYYYRHRLKDKNVSQVTEWLPIVGGLAFGLNTLISVTKKSHV